MVWKCIENIFFILGYWLQSTNPLKIFFVKQLLNLNKFRRGNNHDKNVFSESKTISYLINLKGYFFVDTLTTKSLIFLKKLFLVKLYLYDTYFKKTNSCTIKFDIAKLC